MIGPAQHKRNCAEGGCYIFYKGASRAFLYPRAASAYDVFDSPFPASAADFRSSFFYFTGRGYARLF